MVFIVQKKQKTTTIRRITQIIQRIDLKNQMKVVKRSIPNTHRGKEQIKNQKTTTRRRITQILQRIDLKNQMKVVKRSIPNTHRGKEQIKSQVTIVRRLRQNQHKQLSART